MIDLHIHTIYSDGEYDENEIIEKVKNAHIKEFAICDHDTIVGSKKVYECLKKQKSNLIFHSGVELTSRLNNFMGGVNMHLLVRDFDYEDKNVLNLINTVSKMREDKIWRMVNFANKTFNVKLPENEIFEALKHTKSFGKPHIYKILCKYADVERELFYKKMKGLNTDDLKLDALLVLKEVKKGKGNVTLAHPIEIMDEYDFSYQDIEKIVEYLQKFGLDAIETKHSKQTANDFEEFSKIAKKFNLKQTCGSDFHGENVKPNVKIGICEKIN